MKLIRRGGPILPGGYPYTDPRTGAKFDGFDAGGFGDQVVRIVKYRTANPHLFPDPQWMDPGFVAVQLDEFQCLRLGNNPRYCSDGVNRPVLRTTPAAPKAATPPTRVAGNKCDCGGDLAPIYCKTCSGQRVTGWKCSTCARQYGK